MSMLTSEKNVQALTEAYHAVYDAKDKLPPGSLGFYLAYEAAGKIAELMASLGFKAPTRTDGEGRKS